MRNGLDLGFFVCVFKTQLATLNNSLIGITEFSLKKLFENNAAALVSSMALSLVSDSEFRSRTNVVSFIDELLDAYNGYILNYHLTAPRRFFDNKTIPII